MKQEPVAMRYDFDGYGYLYIDSGSGSDWQTRIKDAEPLYTAPQKTYEDAIEECAQRAEAYAYMSPNFSALAKELRAILKKASEK